MSEPSIRASLARMVLRRAAEVWPDDAAAIRAALGPDALDRLERTPGHEWVPLAFEVAIVRAVHARHGDEGARRLGVEIGRAGLEHPLLRPLVVATLGMLGRRPPVLLEIASAAWMVATREAGRPGRARPRAGGATLDLSQLTEVVIRERAYLLRMAGALQALFELARLSTTCDVEWEEGAPRAVLQLSWVRAG